MRQTTLPEQTAKLIELGFVPKMRIKGVCTRYGTVNIENETYFDVGKLIDMLPAKIDGVYCNIDRCGQRSWAISYDPMIYCCNCAELIDALYDMAVKLKAEGVI
jgi:hypothetical protein